MIANPPFHQGRAAEPDLGAAFIAAAARILKPSGRLLLVANRQLPYEAALAAALPPAGEKLSEDGAYKVFAAERPAPRLTARSRRRRCPIRRRPAATAQRLRANLRMVAALRPPSPTTRPRAASG